MTLSRLNTLQIGAESFQTRGGGLNRYFDGLCKHLAAAGADYTALLAGDHDVTDPAVHIYAEPSESMLRRLRAERRVIGRELAANPFNVIAAHFAPYALPALKYRSRSRPLVVHFHGPWSHESKVEGGSPIAVAVKQRIERWVYRRAARCITLSNAFADLLNDSYGIDRQRIDVIPGGIDWQRFNIAQSRAECRDRIGWPTDRPIILCVRRLVRRMGLENLLAAAATIRQRVPNALFLIGGRGPLQPVLEKQIAELRLQDHVRLIGFIPDADLPYAYRAADLSIVPSLALEGFGLIAAESLAAGTPTIVAPVGGLPEVVAGLPYPLVLTATTPAAIADHVCDTLRQNTAEWSDGCREFSKRYDWSVVAPKVVDVYRRAMSEPT